MTTRISRDGWLKRASAISTAGGIFHYGNDPNDLSWDVDIPNSGEFDEPDAEAI
jgi:hypothetical protein